MISKEIVIFGDPEFLNEDGTVRQGADIFENYLHCHTSNAKVVQEGVFLTIGLKLKIVYEKPETVINGEVK